MDRHGFQSVFFNRYPLALIRKKHRAETDERAPDVAKNWLILAELLTDSG
jgi:hypothetical protein